jgi:transcriptional regulator with XRE-family HTH domain
MLKRMIPYQTRAIRKKRGWSQAQLAEEARVTQGVISRAEDPDYGNLTLTTIGRIAAGYDLAVIIKFVPFSELLRQSGNLSEQDAANLPTFEQENASPRPEEGLRESHHGILAGPIPPEAVEEPQMQMQRSRDAACQAMPLERHPPRRELGSFQLAEVG